MEYLNLGRQERSKGANMKQAFLVMLLVVGCAWLIYQINHSRHKADNYGGLEQNWAASLGRKGSSLWLHEIQFPNLGNVHIGEVKSDENSGNADDRASRSDEKEAKVQIRMNTEVDSSIEENEEVEEPETLNDGVWVHTFDDENGVPPGVNETVTVDGEAQIEIVHEENISNDSKENGAFRSNIIEVMSSENDIVEVTFGRSTSVVIDAEANSQSIIAHADI